MGICDTVIWFSLMIFVLKLKKKSEHHFTVFGVAHAKGNFKISKKKGKIIDPHFVCFSDLHYPLPLKVRHWKCTYIIEIRPSQNQSRSKLSIIVFAL